MEESVTESDSDLEDEYEFNVKKALKLSARGHHPFGSKRGRSSSMEDSSSSKKRKADKPKKQSSTISETIGKKHALKKYDQFTRIDRIESSRIESDRILPQIFNYFVLSL